MGSKLKIDWGRFGLISDTERVSERSRLKEAKAEEGFYGGEAEEELFAEEKGDKPWWMSSLLMSERTLFGAWDGVFTSCMMNLFGIIVFLRTGWVIAQAGIVMGSLSMAISILVVVTSVASAVGIVTRTRVESGGIYFLISHVLGSRVGGAIGLVYCFGQAVGISLCVVGFGESMAEVLGIRGIWSERALGAGALLILAVINVAGVKWVIKMQVLLLAMLMLALADFIIGSFVQHHEPGVTGWSTKTWRENTLPNYSPGNSWFTVLGVFFPAVTGCMAGINMSGDLRKPEKDIPVGTLSALAFRLVLAFSFFIFLTFALVLGGTVSRDMLSDSLISEKVSASGILLLIGLYTSTLASTLASLYGTPRILQSIAGEHVIPIMTPLKMGKGPNKLPLLSLLVTVLVTLSFLLIGRINTLAPIVTTPFLATYAAIDYAYFALAVTYQSSSCDLVGGGILTTPTFSIRSFPGQTDLDRLFPERVTHKKVITRSTQSSESSSPASRPSTPKNDSDLKDVGLDNVNAMNLPSASLITGKAPEWYLFFTNRWISLVGAFLKVIMMIAVHWLYGLITILVVLVLYYYIGRAAPGVPPGIAANFNLLIWMKEKFLKLIGKPGEEVSQVVVPHPHPGVEVAASQLTEENLDFGDRSKYHHAKPGEALTSMKP